MFTLTEAIISGLSFFFVGMAIGYTLGKEEDKEDEE